IAPIGYGKTVLMAQMHAHLRARGHDCRWIGLDERYGTVDRVLGGLLDTLASPRTALHPTHALLRGDEPLEQRIDVLLDVLAREPEPVTVFIDNLNSCTDEALIPLLNALVFRTPPSVRLVWSSTNELAFDVGRAKLEGRLRHIGFQELSLDARETGDLLGVDLGRDIGSAGIDAVQQRTEGWPAAVRMAQIVLAASDHPLAALDTFSGSDEDIAALLNRQVLGRFSAQLREFLMSVSLLRSFGAALCRHAIGSDAAQDHLDYLLRRNVFIVPLDRNRQRYRLHGLFREYLAGEAALHLAPERRREVLRRACEWCEQAGDWHDAIDYALAGDDLATACRLIERSAHLYVRENGDIQQFVAWVEDLRARHAEIGWDTHYWYVWALVFQRRYERSLQQHGMLVERFRQRPQGDVAPADLSQRIQHLRICIDFFSDRLDEANRNVELWLEENKNSTPYGTASIGCIKALCLASGYKLPQAWKTMRMAQPVLLEIDGDDMVGWISLIHAVLMAYEGDYQRAYAELQSGLAEARQRLGEGAVLCGTMSLVGAYCAVEMGQDQEAREHLAFAMRRARNNTALDLAACGFEAAIKLWDGHDDALVSVTRLRDIAAAYPPRLSLMLSCYLIRRLLQLGRVDDALAEAERVGLHWGRNDPADAFKGEFAVARLRDLWSMTGIDILIATRRLRRAETLVDREYRIAKDEGRAGRLVELGLVRASLAFQAGDGAAAGRALAGALSRAARRRIVRPFRDQAELVAALAREGKISSWSFALAEERAFFEEVCGSLAPKPAQAQDRRAVEAAAPATASAPTAREAELLALLEMGLSNQEIADRTEVSITTIKWHLKNLYRKLGVSTRTAALARARALAPSPTDSGHTLKG
ncbi:MAG: LuxR C-terminal-related transcriptional regulator, partial [Pseudomonadota bacterium]